MSNGEVNSAAFHSVIISQSSLPSCHVEKSFLELLSQFIEQVPKGVLGPYCESLLFPRCWSVLKGNSLS
jgi:hypothetical protein